MASPMTAAQIVAQLKKWNVPYKEYRDWKTHNRGNRGTGWGPVNGFMVHHTGSDGKDQRELLYNGYSELPGPLCHFGLAQDGTVWLIGWGRANHAGAGDDDVLRAVIDESYGDYPPVDNESNTDGNSRFYGVEIWYSGSHGMTTAQYSTLLKLAAAVCDFHGWGYKSVIGHGEWQPGKWDPGYAPGRMMDMRAVRNDVRDTLARRDSEPVAETPAAKTATYKAVWETDAMAKARTSNDAQKYWQPVSMLRYGAEQAAHANTKADIMIGLLADVKELLTEIKEQLS